jgi:hypothetical protein
MPFDATTLPLSNEIADRLVAIGITPVPLAVVHEYKRKVIVDFSASVRGRDLVLNGTAIWRTLRMYRDLKILERPRKYLGMTNDVSAAPKPIINLAHRVSREIGDAEFELEWFDTDPVLNVICGGRKACLGIWDHGRIVAIADRDDILFPGTIPGAPGTSFWRRWLRIS